MEIGWPPQRLGFQFLFFNFQLPARTRDVQENP
jgi:hypothetical protein